MSPRERTLKKAKLLQRATDHRGNEHERQLALKRYQEMCASEPSVPTKPEFNRVELRAIKAAACVLVGASLLADWLKARPGKRRQRRRASPATARK